MASIEHEYGTKMRLLKVLLAVQEQPFRYTKRELAEIFDVHKDTIKADFTAMRNAGFEMTTNPQHRWGFSADKPFENLKSLLHLPEQDQLVLFKALEKMDGYHPKLEDLKRRLAAIFGNNAGITWEEVPPGAASAPVPAWRRPYLTKYQLLEQAKEAKVQVVLLDYRSSNSNQVNDRLVEPFHVKIEEDTLQAFDVDKQALRHFRMSRIRRIRMTDNAWQHESEHNELATDPFRIVDNNQVVVHLRLKVGAYNELIERFPLTKAYIQEDAEQDIYDFHARVNHNFFGLTNFILGFHHQIVEILQPESLKEHLRSEMRRMKF